MRIIGALATLALLAGVPAHAEATLPASAGARAPIVAFAPDATAYIAATQGTSAAWRVDEAGATKLAPGGVMAALPAGAAGALAIDAAGYVHLAERTPTGITVRRSIDGGVSWDRGTPLGGAPADAVSMVAGRFNSVVEGATLTLAMQIARTVLITRSTDGGLTFAPTTFVARGALGALATDATSDRVWVAMRDDQNRAVVASLIDGALTTVVVGPATKPPALARTSSGRLVLAAVNGGLTVWTSNDGSRWDVALELLDDVDGSAVATGTLGTVAVACWRDTSLMMMRFGDDGAHYESLRVIGSPDAITSSPPAVAGNPGGGFLAGYATAAGIETLVF
jgi:hypothetical protein